MPISAGHAIYPLDPPDAPRSYAVVTRIASERDWGSCHNLTARARIIEHIRAIAPGTLRSETPEVGWIAMDGAPCGELRPGARPVWLWRTE